MGLVVRKFINGGLSVQEIVVRMDVPTDYVKFCMA